MKDKKPAKTGKNLSITPSQIGTLLEAIHKDVKTIAEGHSGLEKGLNNLEKEVQGNSLRLEKLEIIVGAANGNIETLTGKVGRLEDAVDTLSKELKETKNELKNDIKELSARLTTVESSRS